MRISEKGRGMRETGLEDFDNSRWRAVKGKGRS